MTTRTGEHEDPRVGDPYDGDPPNADRCAINCVLDDGHEEPCDARPDEEQPEPADAPDATCHYCGTVFSGAGDDCGSCPLTGEDLDAYARDRAAADARPATLSFFEQRFLVRS